MIIRAKPETRHAVHASARVVPRVCGGLRRPVLRLPDDARADPISIQPSLKARRDAFAIISDGPIEGLGWDNVLAARGVATLHRPKGDYQNYDLDLCIYGLPPPKPKEKIKHMDSIRDRRSTDKNAKNSRKMLDCIPSSHKRLLNE